MVPRPNQEVLHVETLPWPVVGGAQWVNQGQKDKGIQNVEVSL